MIPRPLIVVLAMAALPGCQDVTSPEPSREAASEAAPSTRVTTIGTLGGERGEARGINNRNEVVGVAEDGEGRLRAFRWKDGAMEELEGLGGDHSGAYGINDWGWIVGEAENEQGEPRPVVWVEGVLHELDTLEGSVGYASAINNRGQIIGHAQNADGHFRPFIWWRDRMGMLPLPPDGNVTFAAAYGINDRGDVVGTWAGGEIRQEALHWSLGRPLLSARGQEDRWSQAEVTVLDTPCTEAAAFAINRRRQIAGSGLGCPIALEILPLVWEGGGGSRYLEPLGGLHEPYEGFQNIGAASAINDRGRVVGYSDAEPLPHLREERATLWDGDEVVDLGGEPPFPRATDINASGMVVGRSGGLPALFQPDGEADTGAARSQGTLPLDRGAGLAGNGRLGVDVRGSRGTAAWASSLCRQGSVRGPPTVAEILAGCGGP